MDSEKECRLVPDEKSSLIVGSKDANAYPTERKIFSSLAKNRDFRRVYYKGCYYGGRYMVLYYLERKYGDETRLGVSASKKIGCAVKRNRVRRIIKEAFSLFPISVKGDVVVVAKAAAVDVKMQDIMKEMTYLFNKILKSGNFVKHCYISGRIYKNKK